MRSRASNRSRPRSSAGTRPSASATSLIIAVLVDHDGHRQRVAASDLEVVRVVRRRDLHDAGAELRIGVVVGDDRDLDVRRSAAGRACRSGRDSARRSDSRRRRRRRASSRDASWRRRARSRSSARPSTIGYARWYSAPVFSVELRFLVAQRREAARAPVDDAMSAVDQPALVQPHERFAHGARQLGAEACTRCATSRPTRRSRAAARGSRRPSRRRTRRCARRTPRGRGRGASSPSLASCFSTTFCVAMPA